MGLLFIGAVRLLVLVGGIGFRRLIGHTNQAIAAVAGAPDGGLLHVPEGGRPDFSFVGVHSRRPSVGDDAGLTLPEIDHVGDHGVSRRCLT